MRRISQDSKQHQSNSNLHCANTVSLPKCTSMEVTYELTQKDFHDSFVAHRNRSALSKWSYRLLAIIAFLFVGIGLIGVMTRPSSKALADLARLSILALFWVGLVWVIPWWNAKNQFSKQPAARGSRTMVLDNAGIHWQWNGGSGEVEWRNFVRWVECDTEFLIYSSPACFNIVPKRALASEQLTEFRALLAQNLTPQSR